MIHALSDLDVGTVVPVEDALKQAPFDYTTWDKAGRPKALIRRSNGNWCVSKYFGISDTGLWEVGPDEWKELPIHGCDAMRMLCTTTPTEVQDTADLTQQPISLDKKTEEKADAPVLVESKKRPRSMLSD